LRDGDASLLASAPGTLGLDHQANRVAQALEFLGGQRHASPKAWSFLFDIVHHHGQIFPYLHPDGFDGNADLRTERGRATGDFLRGGISEALPVYRNSRLLARLVLPAVFRYIAPPPSVVSANIRKRRPC
jgi:hypothetical protein